LSAPTEDDAPTTAEPAGPQPPKVRGLIIWGLIGLVLVAVGTASLLMGRHTSSSGQSQGTATIKVGDRVPAFGLANLDGKGIVAVPKDGGGDGKPLVLVFFASWCGPCQREMPGLAKAVAEGKAGDAAVIGIDGQDTTAAARAFVASTGVTFPVGRDPDYAVTSGKFGFFGLPETVFVNGKGIVTSVHRGPTTPALLEQGVAGF
jgi:peroxiredoxin